MLILSLTTISKTQFYLEVISELGFYVVCQKDKRLKDRDDHHLLLKGVMLVEPMKIYKLG